MRLNLGCGDRYADGWHNVDQLGCPHRMDQTVDLTGLLPSSWRMITHVYAGHILEHLFVGDVLELLSDLRDRMAAPGGQLMVVGPDVAVAQKMAEAGTLEVTMDSLVNGGHRWHGDEHRWQCTGPDVQALLWHTGWQNVTQLDLDLVPDFWPVADRGPRWQCAVSANP